MNDRGADDDYVPLGRYLWDHGEALPSAFVRRNRGAGFFAPGKTWSDYLVPTAPRPRPEAVVLIAPSNAGKSQELKHQAAALAEQGHFAFAARAVKVAKAGLRQSLSGADQRRFDQWNRSARPGMIFVDAVDEVHIRGNSFEDVALKLSQAVDFATCEVQLVLSARTGTWRPEDRKALARLLRNGRQAVKELTLEPLSIEQVGLLAQAAGVGDAAALCAAIRDEELDDLLDFHPMLARVFIRYWKKHGCFGTWTEMLDASVESAVREQNPNRQRSAGLSPGRMRKALCRMAAAGLVTKKPYVALAADTTVHDALDAAVLFDDWPPKRLSELFARAFFFHKGEDVVQLPQGALNHFLAAAWFAERVRRGRDPVELADELTIAAFHDGELEVPASYAPVVGWIASAVPKIRSRLVEVQPRILLYEGDPARLTPADIERALRRLCVLIDQGKLEPSPSRATVRKLAVPLLAPVVLDLLEKYRRSWRVERHLIEYVELGRYRECIAHLLAVATDRSARAGTRILAIGAIGSVGGHGDRQLLLGEILDPQAAVRAALVEALVPEELNGEAAVTALLGLRGDSVRYTIRSIASKLPLADLDATLCALRPLLETSVVSEETIAYRDVCVTLVIDRLGRPGATILGWFPGLLFTLEKHLEHHTEGGVGRRRLREALRQYPDLRRLLWRERIGRALQEGVGLDWDQWRLDQTEVEDLGWLWTTIQEVPLDSRVRRDLLGVIDSTIARAPAEDCASHVGQLAPALVARIEEYERTIKARQERQAAKEAEERQREHTERSKRLAGLELRRDAIGRGEAVNDLGWALDEAGAESSRGHIDRGKLRELVGNDLAAVFEAGFKGCWRRYAVALPAPGGTTVATCVGLAGVTLEFRDGLQASTLTDDDARLAARYALHELTKLPPWLNELLVAHPEPVKRVIADGIRQEWKESTLWGRLIAQGPGASAALAAVVADTVLELGEKEPPPAALRRIVGDAILWSSAPRERIVEAIGGWIQASDPGDMQCQSQYLRSWAHVDPEGAAEWIQAMEARSQAQAADLVIEVAALLHDDFRFDEMTDKSRFFSMSAQAAWLPVLFRSIRPADDLERHGSWTPTTRDHSQDLRDRCVKVVQSDPSAEARAILLRLRGVEALSPRKDWWETVIECQLGVAAEAAIRVWEAHDVVEVEQGDERRPRSMDDLHQLLVRHLGRVARLVENQDYSYAGLLKEEAIERDYQLWVATNLELVSGRLYTVVRENAVQGENKVDISGYVSGLAGRVPIEIKPTARQSLESLKATMDEQLVGRYMRPSDVTHGILLIINNKVKQSRVEGQLQGFSALLAALRQYAREVGTRTGKTIAVVGIDVMVGRQP